MAEMKWTTVLALGLPKLDEQHKELISYSNSLLQAMINGMGKEVLELLFEKLGDYTDHHFTDEEQYMEQIGYPDLEPHKTAHKKLLIDLNHFREKVLSDQGLAPEKALDFLNGWIINHIMAMDNRIAEFANKRS